MKRNLNIKIAYWYYTLGMTQDEIAKRLSFTRQKVNQIINSLVDLDVVTINIHGYERDNIELEGKIEERFGLKEAIVATDYGEKDTAIYKVANVAAQYLDETIQQGDIIGVSWGRTLAEVVDQMTFKRRSECRVVQLMGAQNIERPVEKSDEIARGLADRLDCPSYMLYAPVVVEHAETKKWLLKERSIKASYELMKKCNIAVLGVGELTEKSTMCTRGHITPDDIRILREQGFVGDIAMNPVRLDGSYDECPLTDRLLNADMECLKNIANTVLVACGEEKVEAIRAVLCSGCIDRLIIDETTARQVMEV
ncbi:sugar-binding transcriptional regulator [Sporofaciens sp. SGI.106]|uniref:sugar-binding transcriptional regulator n=1 Tax=Sporofaciens sp. SGI.106 TaxID=3420568 RepID=UPI002AA04907|nr:sugar-binding transcriptional regulator [Lachnoclostridium sp.]